MSMVNEDVNGEEIAPDGSSPSEESNASIVEEEFTDNDEFSTDDLKNEEDTYVGGSDEDITEESLDGNLSEKDSSQEELLSDGTSRNKKISVDYEKFQEMNTKAKKLDELQKRHTNLGTNVEERITKLEADKNKEREKITSTVLKKAIDQWGTRFREKWSVIKPRIVALEANGVPYDEAVETAYFSIDPEAAKSGERIAERANEQGVMTSSNRQRSPVRAEEIDKDQNEVYQLAGLTKERVKKLKESGYDIWQAPIGLTN